MCRRGLGNGRHHHVAGVCDGIGYSCDGRYGRCRGNHAYGCNRGHGCITAGIATLKTAADTCYYSNGNATKHINYNSEIIDGNNMSIHNKNSGNVFYVTSYGLTLPVCL